MTTKTYEALLEGVDAFDLSMSVLRDLCDLFVEGAQRAVRLAVEGRSAAKGTTPTWVSAAGDVRISRFASGSLDISVRAPRLSDVAPELFAQEPLFAASADSTLTAFDLFLDAADDACAGRRDSERLDKGLLDVLARAGSLFSNGATQLQIKHPSRSLITLDYSATTRIKRLAEETPPSRVVRIRGLLDTLALGARTVVLRLDDGKQLRGLAGKVSFDELKEHFGEQVVLEGSITFKPSGEAHRIDVDWVARATPRDLVWARLPKPDANPSRPQSRTPSPDLDSLFGAWPGDESDAELAAALRDAS